MYVCMYVCVYVSYVDILFKYIWTSKTCIHLLDYSKVCLLELGLVLLSHRPPKGYVATPNNTSNSRPDADTNPKPDANTETTRRDQSSNVGRLAKWVEDVAAGRVRPTLTHTNRVQLKYLYQNLNGIL